MLEELGINFDYIRRKSYAVLHPLKKDIDSDLLNDADLSGPFCFALLLGSILLLSGKWMFDYIYGFGAVGCISMYFLVNLMAVQNVDIYKTLSILGYCLLPMNLLAALSVVLSLGNVFGVAMAMVCISWCSYSAALLFTEQNDPEQKLLVFYPLVLYYTCFALLTIF
uniref:Protein YIPF n=1 Tax=Arcella intermedia TaxID=1963864 RepID=A0A6B2LIP4_9EUKA